MDRVAEIRAFAREYVNGTGQTPERKKLIQAVYFQLFHERLRATCGTCFIEGIFKIIKMEEKKPCKYRLRKGQIIQPFGGGIIINSNITDEIVEQALQDGTANRSMFDIFPEDPVIMALDPEDLPNEEIPELDEIREKVAEKTPQKKSHKKIIR